MEAGSAAGGNPYAGAGDPAAVTYNDPDLTGNINGSTIAFREPLRRVHKCVFGVLGLDSEPVDPRL